MEPKRLNKYLVEAGVCSRREADRLIAAGKVLVNNVPAELGVKVDGTEQIVVNGKAVDKPSGDYVYLAYYKPVGVICTADPEAAGNIIQAVNYPERLFTVGRLDVGSSGLILLTNDGEVANKITQAKGQHEKEYLVTIDRRITPEFLHAMATGIEILGRKTMPAQVEQVDDTTFMITLVEGRNRQIRRMCEAMNVNVKALKRTRVMNIELGDLRIGEWRHLTPTEVKELLGSLHLNHSSAF
ncbi:MAG: pseudouridine synthase [Patescibacteria group bacterium]